MANSRNRWELEEKRKKQREQAANAILQDIKSGGSYKGNAVQQTVFSAGKQAGGAEHPQPRGQQEQPEGEHAGAQHGQLIQLGGAHEHDHHDPREPASRAASACRGCRICRYSAWATLSSAGSSLHRVGSTTREDYLAGGAARRRSNIDSRTGTNTSRGTQRERTRKTCS